MSRVLMRRLHSVAYLVVAGMVSLAALSGCGESPSPERDTNHLRRGNVAEPSTLDPHKSVMKREWTILRDLYVGLTYSAADGSAVPGAAESWDVSSDGLTYTFYLRSGLVWSDGTAMSSADFVAGLQRLFDPRTASPAAPLVYMIKNARSVSRGEMPISELGVSAPDGQTIIIVLERPTPILPQILATPFAAPYPASDMEKATERGATPAPSLSNGPYILEEWVPDAAVRLSKNPRFFESDNVAIDRVTYVPTPDDEAALNRYRAGELDLNGWFAANRQEWLNTNLPGEARSGPALGVSYLVFNMRRAPFNDAGLRRALALAVDRPLLASKVLDNGVMAANGFVPSPVAGYSTLPRAETGTDTAIAEAQEIMKTAGYGPDSPFSFEMRVRDTPDDRRVAASLMQMWKRIFAEVDLVTTDVKTHFDDLESGNFLIGDAGWALFDSPESFLFLLSSRDAANLNYGSYDNEAYNQAYEQGLAQTDTEERRGLFQNAEAIALEDQAVIPLYYYRTRTLVKPYLKGFVVNPADIHPSRYMSLETGPAEN